MTATASENTENRQQIANPSGGAPELVRGTSKVASPLGLAPELFPIGTARSPGPEGQAPGDWIYQFISDNRTLLIFLSLALIFILFPIPIHNKKRNNLQHGGQEQQLAGPPPSNSILQKFKGAIERVGSGIYRVLTVIGGVFLIFGLISLPFIIYAIVFYFVIKKAVMIGEKM